jgi:hypothetical protein
MQMNVSLLAELDLHQGIALESVAGRLQPPPEASQGTTSQGAALHWFVALQAAVEGSNRLQ